MVNVCPAESDPRETVEAFVANRNEKTMAGLRAEGAFSLMDIIEAEIRRQRPGTRIIRLDRDVLCDNGIDFERDLQRYLDSQVVTDGPKAILVREDLPVIGWEMCLGRYKGRGDIEIIFASTACKQVPLATRL